MNRLSALCLLVATGAFAEPAKAKLKVTTVPPGAVVSFDLDAATPGPRTVTDVTPGDHRVEAYGALGGAATTGGIWYVGAKNFALTEGQDLTLELQMKVDGQFNRRLEAQVLIDVCAAQAPAVAKTLPLAYARAQKALPKTNIGFGVATSAKEGALTLLASMTFSAVGVSPMAATCTDGAPLAGATQLAASTEFQVPLGLHRRGLYVVTNAGPKKRDLEALKKWSSSNVEVLIVAVPTAAVASAWTSALKKVPRAVAVTAPVPALPDDATEAQLEAAAAWIEPVVAAHRRFLATLPEAK